MTSNFSQRKKDILSKIDKSSKGDCDSKIFRLCEAINKLDSYYTTSSCAGRVVILIDQNKKAPNLFKFVTHDLIDFDNFYKYLPKDQAKLDLKFKQEPCILHVACENLDDAKKLLRKAQVAGWKRSGIISSGDRLMLELNATDKLEFPLMQKGRILVSDEFLKVVIKKANENLKKSWDKIEKLRRVV